MSSALYLLLLPILVLSCTDYYCKYCPISVDICVSCKPGYYLNSTNCDNCSVIANCSQCSYSNSTDEVTCTACNSPFGLNSSSNTCQICNSTDNNCVSCKTDDNNSSNLICLDCKTNTVLSNGVCLPCFQAIQNCSVCNNTKFPVSCVNCQSPLLTNLDSSSCQACDSLISDCAVCDFQAPFEQAQCVTCGNGKQLSDDKLTCQNPSHVGLIVGIVVGVVVLIGVVGFGIYWFKKKRARRSSPLVEDDDSYEKPY